MRKYGKYEKMPDGTRAKQPAAKSMLLQTYLTSLLCMVLCVAMFFGTTFAWFTSEVTNEGNEIYIGILNVDLVDADGKSLDGNTNPLFNKNVKWEPGYTALEAVKVVNDNGDLAFRYELTLKEDGSSELDSMDLNEVAKWFDVWCYHDDQNKIPKPDNWEQITEVNGWTKVGSLDEVLAGKVVFRGSMTKEAIEDDPAAAHTYTIALHMNGENGPEKPIRMDGEADDDWKARIDEWEQQVKAWQKSINALMGKTIGLNVKLVATQLSSETDAFGATYDLGAFANTLAEVTELSQKEVECNPWGEGNTETIPLDVAYQFQPVESYEEALASPYKNYVADFVISANQDVSANSMALAGYYKAYCDWKNDGKWIVLTSPEAISANTEVRLVDSMDAGVVVSYEALCQLGNDGVGFLCGAADVSGDDRNSGTTITVELRLFETDENGEETGRFITVGSYDYTFN